LNGKPDTLLHARCYLCMVPVLGYLVSPARLPCRDCVRCFIEEQVAVLAHHWLLTHIRRTVQKVMEVAIPPLTILHPHDCLFCAELRPNPCRRTAGRTIPHLSLLQYSDTEAVFRQPNRNQRARCATTNNNDVFSRSGVYHAFSSSFRYLTGRYIVYLTQNTPITASPRQWQSHRYNHHP